MTPEQKLDAILGELFNSGYDFVTDPIEKNVSIGNLQDVGDGIGDGLYFSSLVIIHAPTLAHELHARMSKFKEEE